MLRLCIRLMHTGCNHNQCTDHKSFAKRNISHQFKSLINSLTIGNLGLPTVEYAGFSKGGARKFRKFGNNKDQNENFPAQNQVRFPAQTQVKSKNKKRSSLKFSPVFGPKLGEDQNKRSSLVQFWAEKKVFAHRFCAQIFCPSYKGKGGGGHATILHTILC